MITFSLAQIGAVITNLNPRPEKHGKTEKALAYDINFKIVEVDCEVLQQLSVDEKMDYQGFFYDDKGAVKASGIGKLVFGREYEEHYIRIDFELAVTEKFIRFKPNKIRNFVAEPTFGKKMNLTFQAQLNPSDEDLVFLNHALTKDKVLLTIEGPSQQDLFRLKQKEIDSEGGEDGE